VNPAILLSFDLEEFDLPLEYGVRIGEADQFRVACEGLDALSGLLDCRNVRCTFFTTSRFAEAFPEAVRVLAGRHEIASHACVHSKFEPGDPAKSRMILEKITGRPVLGFRMPRLGPVDYRELKACGYSYDSSLNPTWIPGRYNRLSSPRTFFRDRESGLFVLPGSVTPLVRFPLFWLAFKNLPLGVYLRLCRRVLKTDACLNVFFHPWEFADLSSFRIPRYVKTPSGGALLSRLEGLIAGLEGSGEFMTIGEFIRGREANENRV
jgi:hypothetical protein